MAERLTRPNGLIVDPKEFPFIELGHHSVVLPATSFIPDSVSGAELRTLETTEGVILPGLWFDADVEESVQVAIPMPVSYKLGTPLVMRMIGSYINSSEGDAVTFNVATISVESSTFDFPSGFGSPDFILISGEPNKLLYSAWVPVTVTNGQDFIFIKISRPPNSGEINQDFCLHFVNLLYEVERGNDAQD